MWQVRSLRNQELPQENEGYWPAKGIDGKRINNNAVIDMGTLFCVSTGLQAGRGTGGIKPVPYLLFKTRQSLFILHFQKPT